MRKTFLIVDDEPLVRMELGTLVKECGFEPWEASNTSEALSILQQSGDAFSGLITDIHMPGTRSGAVLANHVRTVWPHIKIIVVSGGRRPMGGELPEQTEFLAKPVSSSRLTAMLLSVDGP